MKALLKLPFIVPVYVLTINIPKMELKFSTYNSIKKNKILSYKFNKRIACVLKTITCQKIVKKT